MPSDSNFRVINKIESFDGGLNSKYEPQAIEDIESPDCLNVMYDDLGSVQTRFGYTKLNTTAVGSYTCDGIFTTRFNNGNSTLVAWYNGTMYTNATSTFTAVGSAASVFTAGNQVDFGMYQNLAFFGAGTTAYKYNGTDFNRMGVPAPNSTPTASGTSAGNPSGDYQYKITYVNSFAVEGDVTTATTTINVSSQQIGLTNLPLAPTSFGVTARNIYRTVAGGTEFKYVGQVADNTTTTYADNVADGSLGVTAPTDQGVPPNFTIMKVFQERIFCVDVNTNPQYLYYSELAEPFTFKTTNFILISDGDGEKIVGLGVHSNSLIVYKENSVWLIYMPDTTPSNWIRVKTNAKYGCGSHRSIVDYEGLQMFLGMQRDKITGFYAFNGESIQPDATFLTTATLVQDSKSDKIEDDVLDFVDAYSENCHGVLYKSRLWFAVTKTSGSTTNNRVYTFDFIRRDKSRMTGAWVPHTGINAAMFVLYNSKLYFASAAADGFIYQLDDGTYTDNGSAINSYFNTKEFEGRKNDADFEKDFIYANFIVEKLGDWDMNVTHLLDSESGSGDTEAVNLNAGNSLWGSMIWGVDDWGAGGVRENVKIDLLGKVGKRIQFKFDNQNTASQGFKVIKGNFYYNRRGLR